MNRKIVFVTVLLLTGVSLACAGCAVLPAKRAAVTEDLLSQAGFVPKQPANPEDLAKLEKVKPLTMTRAKRNAKVLYLYSDPYTCKCVYVGTEEQYQEYSRLARQKGLPMETPGGVPTWETGFSDRPDDFWW